MRSPVAAYGVSLAGVAAAMGLQRLFEPWLHNDYFLMTLFAALIFAAWYGGRGPALLALVAGAVAAVFDKPEFQYGVAIYGAVGLAFIVFAEVLRKARRQAEVQQQQQFKQEHDITARKRSEGELAELVQRLTTLVDNTPLAVVEMDADFRITRWSGQAEKVFGWTAADVLGKATMDFELVYREDVPKVDTIRARLRDPANRYVVSRNRNNTKSGAVISCEWYNSILHDDTGRMVAVLCLILDVTERERAVAALQEADRRKDEFLATLAHELRNPLAPIRTGLEVMKLAQNDPVTLENVRSMMERQTRQLTTLVDDLLDVSRITRGKLELRKCRVQLTDVVQSAVEASGPFIDEVGHELTVIVPEHPVYLQADPYRLAQILANLLNNAAKYTPAGGQICLHAQRQGSEVLLVVRDSGIGIPSEMQTCIFDLFTQIDRPLEKRYTGLGIGLTLVKSLVDMHGGRVEVYSEGSNRGSEFRVHLPVAVDMPVAMPAPVQTGGEATTQFRRKVLIVDDNQEAAITLSIVVRMFGSEVRTAGDGQEGIQAAAEFLPDVILMDLGMPGMNGYEAARHIRRQSWGEQMLIVALTGWGQDEDRQRTREAGFDHHLVKPVESSELQKVLETVATSAGAARGICQTTCRLAGS